MRGVEVKEEVKSKREWGTGGRQVKGEREGRRQKKGR